MTNIIFCQLGGLFFALIPPNQPEKSKFWKTEKSNQRYYHFTHMSHKWHSYDVWFLRYEAWQTEFFVSLDCFFPFYPSNNQKNQNFEKLKKNPGDIIILHKCPKNHDHMLCCSWDMAHDEYICYFSFWAIFCPFTALFLTFLPFQQPKKSKFQKMKRKAWRYHHFTNVYQKLWLGDARFLRYDARQTDGRKKWHIEVGAPPKNIFDRKWM